MLGADPHFANANAAGFAAGVRKGQVGGWIVHVSSLPAGCGSMFEYGNLQWPAEAGHRFEGVAGTVSLSGAPPRRIYIKMNLFQTPRKYLTNAGRQHKIRNTSGTFDCFLGKEKAHEHKLWAEREEHQCSGTGSHTGHRYVHMLTPPSFLQHRESTGVFQDDLKPGDFSVRSKSRDWWMEANRNSRGSRAKKKPADERCGLKRRNINAAEPAVTPDIAT